MSVPHWHRNLGAVSLTSLLAQSAVTPTGEPLVEMPGKNLVQTELTAAVEARNENVAAARLLGTLFLAQRDYLSAETWSLRYLRRFPTDPIANLRLGYVYYLTGKEDQAIKTWSAGKAVPYVLRNLATTQVLGASDEFTRVYCKVKDADPDSVTVDTRVAIAWVYDSWGEMAKAEAEFLDAAWYAQKVAIPQVQGYVLGELGTYYVRRGRYQDATRVLDQALVLIPDAANYRLWLGGAYKLLGNLAKAKSELHSALANADRPTTGYIYANLGEIYVQEGDRTRAADAFAKALKVFPDDKLLQGQYDSLRTDVP